jgi:hypothetical protein
MMESLGKNISVFNAVDYLDAISKGMENYTDRTIAISENWPNQPRIWAICPTKKIKKYTEG